METTSTTMKVTGASPEAVNSANTEADSRQRRSLSMPRVAVAGVSGYAGEELARILLRHPRFTGAPPIFLGRAAEIAASEPVWVESLHPQLSTTEEGLHEIVPFEWSTLSANGTEVLLLATPHEQSREWVPEALARGIRVVDLSGAWRLQDPANRSVYRLTDKNPELAKLIQAETVYGLPELHRDAIVTAQVVANPGCYATSIILALAPFAEGKLVDMNAGIICDSKSGVSGAGKSPTSKTHFMYAADNLSAYSVFGHRHTGELLEQLHLTSDQIQFTPHLLPIPRGILSTIYLRLRRRFQAAEIFDTFTRFYAGSSFVRVRRPGMLPQIQHVVRSNFCDIGFELAPDGKRLVIVSCLDNLLKGAAGQAVQNLNLMYGWKETEGLL